MAARAKTAEKIDIDLRLIAEVEAAALKWMGHGGKIDHMDLGRRFLAYLKGEATFVQIERDGSRYEPPTCGTAHLTAERSLRIIENATRLGESISGEAIDAITNLVEQAGIHNARQTLRDDVPF